VVALLDCLLQLFLFPVIVFHILFKVSCIDLLPLFEGLIVELSLFLSRERHSKLLIAHAVVFQIVMVLFADVFALP